MKKPFLCLLLLILITPAFVQNPRSAEKGVLYGAGTTSFGAINISELEKNVKNNSFKGKITGKIAEVCQEKGCWMKIERADGENLMVKFKELMKRSKRSINQKGNFYLLRREFWFSKSFYQKGGPLRLNFL